MVGARPATQPVRLSGFGAHTTTIIEDGSPGGTVFFSAVTSLRGVEIGHAIVLAILRSLRPLFRVKVFAGAIRLPHVPLRIRVCGKELVQSLLERRLDLGVLRIVV